MLRFLGPENFWTGWNDPGSMKPGRSSNASKSPESSNKSILPQVRLMTDTPTRLAGAGTAGDLDTSH
jgi:hypothetical protein